MDGHGSGTEATDVEVVIEGASGGCGAALSLVPHAAILVARIAETPITDSRRSRWPVRPRLFGARWFIVTGGVPLFGLSEVARLREMEASRFLDRSVRFESEGYFDGSLRQIDRVDS